MPNRDSEGSRTAKTAAMWNGASRCTATAWPEFSTKEHRNTSPSIALAPLFELHKQNPTNRLILILIWQQIILIVYIHYSYTFVPYNKILIARVTNKSALRQSDSLQAVPAAVYLFVAESTNKTITLMFSLHADIQKVKADCKWWNKQRPC